MGKEDWGGQGESSCGFEGAADGGDRCDCRCAWDVVFDVGDEEEGSEDILSFDANVSVGGWIDSVSGICGGLAARLEVAPRDENGFTDCVAPVVVEVLVENGFVPCVEPVGGGDDTPNSIPPRFVPRLFAFSPFSLSPPTAFSVVFTAFPSPLTAFSPVLLTSLIALILPTFRAHPLFLQQNKCSRRSSCGNRDLSSALSCSSRLMGLPQTLHFAREPKGVWEGSRKEGKPPRWLWVLVSAPSVCLKDWFEDSAA